MNSNASIKITSEKKRVFLHQFPNFPISAKRTSILAVSELKDRQR